MERLITQKILKWSKKENSLPLIILGARQIGKTYSVKGFANKYYKNNYLYLNFLDKKDEYKLLKNMTNPKDIINTLELIFQKNIEHTTLIIFDEIQEMPNIKTSLKHFVEQNLKHKIICLGSYLGNMLNDKESFPVGKIETIEMFPMNFEEFLLAHNNKKIIQEKINEIKDSIISKKAISQSTHLFMIDKLYEFLIIGGMPKVLQTYFDNKNLLECNLIKSNLINDYKNDIVKYINNNSDKIKAQVIYDNIPSFLAKVNKKYKLSNIDKNARFLNYQNAINSLLITKIVYKINNLETFNSPIKFHKKDSEFKIYYNDPGFISSVFSLTKDIILNNHDYSNIKGALFENFLLSELAQKIDINAISYYSFRDKNSNEFEIDFCIENQLGKLIPIEVKSSKEFKTKSLNKLLEEKEDLTSIIFSLKNINSIDNKITKLPIYCIGFLDFEINRINWEKNN